MEYKKSFKKQDLAPMATYEEIDVMVSQNAIPARKHLGSYNHMSSPSFLEAMRV